MFEKEEFWQKHNLSRDISSVDWGEKKIIFFQLMMQ